MGSELRESWIIQQDGYNFRAEQEQPQPKQENKIGLEDGTFVDLSLMDQDTGTNQIKVNENGYLTVVDRLDTQVVYESKGGESLRVSCPCGLQTFDVYIDKFGQLEILEGQPQVVGDDFISATCPRCHQPIALQVTYGENAPAFR